MAFKALLMGSRKAKPKPDAPLPKPALRAPEPARGVAHPSPKPAGDDKPAAVGAKALIVDEEKPKPPKAKPNAGERDAELLDPSTRLAAQLAPPMASAPAAVTEQVGHRARVSLEELVPQVLRRIAWGGDRTKGSAQLELTSGDKITVHAEGRRVRVEVDGNPELEARIGSRLRAAGIEVER